MAEVYVGYVDVDIDLREFDTSELIEELDRRDVHFTANSYLTQLLKDLHQKRRTGQDYTWELDTIIYETIGRVS